MIRRRDADAFQEAWDRGLPSDGELADLIHTAERVSQSATSAPSPQFREALRERLMLEAESVLVAEPVSRAGATAPSIGSRTSRHSFRRRAAALTGAVVTSVGAVTLVTSSAQAVPGEMLYPVKIGVENVQLTLKSDDADRGSYQLERASERLREADALAVDATRHDDLPAVLQDFTTQAEDGSSALFRAYETSADEHDIATVTEFAEQATTMLTSLSARDMPKEYAEAWERAAEAINGLADRSSQLCTTCTRADVDDLVRSVAAEVEKTQPVQKDRSAAPKSDSPKRSSGQPSSGKPSKQGNGTSSSPGSDTAPGPAATPPRLPKPGVTSTPRPPRLKDVTDPVVGGLLGNDEKEGLVPGLLGGLLGGKK